MTYNLQAVLPDRLRKQFDKERQDTGKTKELLLKEIFEQRYENKPVESPEMALARKKADLDVLWARYTELEAEIRKDEIRLVLQQKEAEIQHKIIEIYEEGYFMKRHLANQPERRETLKGLPEDQMRIKLNQFRREDEAKYREMVSQRLAEAGIMIDFEKFQEKTCNHTIDVMRGVDDVRTRRD